MIYFIGDVHGRTIEYTKILSRRVGDAPCLQLGDMGLGFSGLGLPVQLPQHRFIRGNHDDPIKCRAHANYAGEFGVTPEGVFFVGGAWSIDSAWRKVWNKENFPRKVWWQDEELSQEQLDEALKLYALCRPAIVATHEAPTDAARYILSDGFRPEKADCANTRTSQALQKMFDLHQPKRWLFGHYHKDLQFQVVKDDVVQPTIFNCLNELSLLGIEEEDCLSTP